MHPPLKQNSNHLFFSSRTYAGKAHTVFRPDVPYSDSRERLVCSLVSDLDDESLRAVHGKFGWLALLRKEQLCNQNLQVILAGVNFVGHANLCCAEAQAGVWRTACVAVLPMDPFHHLLAVRYGL
jgi:hypothetical protein